MIQPNYFKNYLGKKAAPVLLPPHKIVLAIGKQPRLKVTAKKPLGKRMKENRRVKSKIVGKTEDEVIIFKAAVLIFMFLVRHT